MIEFFRLSQNKKVLIRFRSILESIPHGTEFERQRNEVIKHLLFSMIDGPDQWDQNCQINIEWIGSHLINSMSQNVDKFSKIFLDDVCSTLFRFLYELYLSTPNDLAVKFDSDKKFVISNVDQFEGQSSEEIKYTIYQMPILIFKHITNSEGVAYFKNFNDFVASSEKIKMDWDHEIKAKEEKVKALKESLEKYEKAFNFVGLFQGFDELADKKISERDNTLLWLRVLGFLILLPIISEFLVVLLNFKNVDGWKNALLISFFPVASFVTIMIYYFRILLFNYKSVKAQLLQIELRKTLCRFIQHYAEYASQLKKQDNESLAKFENIIFSGLVSDDASLPSSYDGIEQLANLVKSIKS